MHKRPDKLPFTLSDAMGRILMDEPLRPGEGILHHPEGVDLMPADIQLSGMEVSLVNAMSRETILRQYLDTVKGQYSHRDILFSAGIPYRGRGKGPRLHDLRHTFCVHSLQKLTAHGEDPYAVLPLLMTYMGHRSVQATSQYIHLSAESFPAILKQSEALFGNLIPLEDISNETSI